MVSYLVGCRSLHGLRSDTCRWGDSSDRVWFEYNPVGYCNWYVSTLKRDTLGGSF